ncbi:MAG: TolC family protein [Acidobacteriota bacterium]
MHSERRLGAAAAPAVMSMRSRTPRPAVRVMLLGAAGWAALMPAILLAAEHSTSAPPPRPADALLESLEPDALRDLARETLERNPELARARHHAAARAVRAPQVRSLPDPVAALTWFVLPPETRVGPQRLSIAVRQAIPWLAGLEAREQAALWAAAAAEAELESRRLQVLTELRRLVIERSFADLQSLIVRAERDTLARYEEAAQARYSVGTGLQQEVVRIQSQITEVDRRELEIAQRRVGLSASLNALRDRPATAEIPAFGLPLPRAPSRLASFDAAELAERAERRRPELAAARARLAEAEAHVDVATAGFRPGFEVGVAYTAVDGRGGAGAPADDGDDVLALTGGLRLPVRRARLEAALEQALAEQRAADAGLRGTVREVESKIGDLVARLPLLHDQWQLLAKVLGVQARESLSSAESAYTTGRLNAVDLLDAEVLQLEVRIGVARTRADFAIAHAHLEAAVAAPISLVDPVSGETFESDSTDPDPASTPGGSGR